MQETSIFDLKPCKFFRNVGEEGSREWSNMFYSSLDAQPKSSLFYLGKPDRLALSFTPKTLA
jgi:hypothetical protein